MLHHFAADPLKDGRRPGAGFRLLADQGEMPADGQRGGAVSRRQLFLGQDGFGEGGAASSQGFRNGQGVVAGVPQRVKMRIRKLVVPVVPLRVPGQHIGQFRSHRQNPLLAGRAGREGLRGQTHIAFPPR